MATYDVAHRSAIVTGAGSGIGRAVALLLAANGAAVLVHDLKADAADEDVAVAAVEAAERPAPLRIAVNNAGIGGPAPPVGEYPTEAWRAVVDVNLNGVFYGLRAQIPAIARNGGGAIVNMGSVLGSVGIAGSSAYVATKHALVGLTKNAALEHAADGVRVTAVGPGFISTPLLEANLDPAARAEIAAQHALNRLGTSEEVANLVAFLASDAATFVTGSYHLVDGGYAAH